jgi:adenylosuccinate synthase
MGKLTVVVGGQYGSEAKGAVTAWLARLNKDEPTSVVRVAGPNAGHTAYDATGKAWALRQVPVGLVSNLEAVGVIADGSEVDLPVLLDEIDQLERGGIPVRQRLAISRHATLLTDEHRNRETGDGIAKRIGSTGKGIGAARADRIMRTADTYNTVKAKGLTMEEFCRENYADPGFRDLLDKLKIDFDDLFVSGSISEYLREIAVMGFHIIIEGTQGYGLGLHRPEYPQVTSSDTRAIDFCAMAGINPWDPGVDEFEVYVVVRAFPIRVAGNSGPLKDETTWEELGLPEERTTVTKKVRRVGGWDQVLFDQAVAANGGPRRVRVAYTMADQEVAALAGLQGNANDLMSTMTQEQVGAIGKIIEKTRGLVTYVGTGPNSQITAMR